MINNTTSFQDAVARARQIAQKLSAGAPNGGGSLSLKRSNDDDDSQNKRAAGSSLQASDLPAPVLRAQLIAQQINSQLGVKSSNDLALVPLSNQLQMQEEFKIPDRFVGLIIGKGGEQIIRMQAETGCKIQICPARTDAPDRSGMAERLATLSGSKESIERAKRIMEDIIGRGRIADGGSYGSNPYSMAGANSKTVEVMLPSAKCGYIIGKGGETIKRASEEFNVKMFVGQDTVELDGIEHKPLRLTGDPENVERARQYVLDSLSKSSGGGTAGRFGPNAAGPGSSNDYGSRIGGGPMSGPCNEAIYHAPHDRAGIIIGKGGETIKEINRRSGAYVELDKSYAPSVGNSADRLFKIRGTPDQIVAAQQLMFEKVYRSASGPGDMVTPIQFQQQFNLPLVGSGLNDNWGSNNDSYGNDSSAAAASDPYSLWASAYGQWPQGNPYDTSASGAAGASGADASAASQMDPAWMAYYQSMAYYNMMQANMTGATSSSAATSTTTTAATDSTAASNGTASTSAANSTAGQPDYSQQWIEYYRSIGQNDVADQIAQQMKQAGSAAAGAPGAVPDSNSAAAQAAAAAMMMSAGSTSWEAYAKWASAANGAGSATASTTNGSSSVPASSS